MHTQDILKVSLASDEAGGSCPAAAPASAAQQRWSPGRDAYCQEPLFVARSGAAAEDDGWVLATVFRAGPMTTELVILDARRLAAGPLATLRLPFHVPIGARSNQT